MIGSLLPPVGSVFPDRPTPEIDSTDDVPSQAVDADGFPSAAAGPGRRWAVRGVVLEPPGTPRPFAYGPTRLECYPGMRTVLLNGEAEGGQRRRRNVGGSRAQEAPGAGA